MTQEHFKVLAEDYDEQIPEYIRSHLLVKKTDLILAQLLKDSTCAAKLKGIDFGCGTGWHVRRLREMGLDVWGLDLSEEMIKRRLST